MDAIVTDSIFLQVFQFGLPEKLGTGQEGPDFLQWDGWEGGVMPKQVLGPCDFLGPYMSYSYYVLGNTDEPWG